MSSVYSGRYTAEIEGDFVVFLIGMRINHFSQFRKWLPVAQAMPGMLRQLNQHPQKGYLGGEDFFRLWPFTSLLLSYWRNFEDLERFARHPEDPHLSAWKAFNRAVGADGSVGIWHETYQVRAGAYENVYGNMPRFGLGRVGQHLPATGRRETARRRLGGQNEPAVPSPVR